MPNDTPDWFRATASPMTQLALAVFNNGDHTVSEGVTNNTAFSGLLCQAPAPVAAGPTTVTMTITGGKTGTVYFNETSTPGEGLTALLGPDAIAELGVTIVVTWGANSLGTNTALVVYGLSGSGVQTVVAPGDQPLPVQLGPSQATLATNLDVAHGTTTTTGDLVVATLNLVNNEPRYVPRAELVATASSSVATGALEMYLKGQTSANTLWLIEAKTNASTPAVYQLSRNPPGRPVDLVEAFPFDTAIDVHVVLPSGCAAGWIVEQTA